MKEIKPQYFSHDTNASTDPKIIHIRMKFGWKAVGMYWAIIESLHKEISGELSQELIYSMILDFYSQEEMRTSSHIIEEAKEFEKALYANALLIECERNATSKRVKENIEEIKTKSEKAKQSAEIRWGKPSKINNNINNANALPTQYERNAIKESKVKESKIVSEGDKSPTPPPKGNGSLTPAEEMRQFCADGQKQQKVVEWLIKYGLNQDTAKNEVEKFIDYWTEMTKSGKQQKWELEKTFEVKRRLATWLKNYEKFNIKNNYGKT